MIFESFHTLTISPETPSGTISPLTTPVAVPPKPLTSRQQVALELLQTEKNYVEILTNILKVINIFLSSGIETEIRVMFSHFFKVKFSAFQFALYKQSL